ncbi:MAG: hypothetical protein IKX24_01510 [Prevotella sp.]|nr:hypothetical protein [Prevotella sp.]
MDDIHDMNRQEPEIPEFTIEHDDESREETYNAPKVPKWKRWLYGLSMLLGLLALMFLALFAYKRWAYYHHIGVPITTSPQENIDKLKQPIREETAEVVLTHDSILGVALDLYAIHGLRASIEFEEPDTTDHSVFLYCRSADHTPDGKYLGSLVAEGKELQSDRTRLGYMAMADGRMVIGISRSEKVKGYVMERGGSFFRQFILVSGGVIPPRFYLHGKVERRAIGRMGNTLYYIATRHKETLWDFADAIREYGFIDAIYITGGNNHHFYRTLDGTPHDIGNVKVDTLRKNTDIIPWLIFRRNP